MNQMDFPAAMRMVLNGNAVWREVWEHEWVDVDDGVLTIHNETGAHPWLISIADMEAIDWEEYTGEDEE